MEPDVIRIYSSSPPPMEDGAEEEDEEFGDFGTFSSVPNSISLSEFDTPTTFDQTHALTATSPPELLSSRGVVGFSHGPANGTCRPGTELPKANGVGPINYQDNCHSDRTETKKPVSCSLDLSVSNMEDSESTECNGGDTGVLTNGFVTFDVQESLSSQISVHSLIKGQFTEDTRSVHTGSSEDEFADFAAFSTSEGHLSQVVDENRDNLTAGGWLPKAAVHNQDSITEQGSEDRDTRETSDGWIADSLQRDLRPERSETDCTNDCLAFSMVDGSNEAAGGAVDDLSPDLTADSEVGQSDEKSSETETSFGRPLSTEALEEYGDMSTTGSVPSPPLQGDTATPAEDDEDFGDFGDAAVFGGQGFGEVQQDQGQDPAAGLDISTEQDDDFGDFNSPKIHSIGNEGEAGGEEAEFPDFPASSSFGNFSSAVGAEEDSGWRAFGEQQEPEEESWASFSTESSPAPPPERKGGEGHEEGSPAASGPGRTDTQLALLSSRLEKLFHTSFPPKSVQNQQEEKQVVSLKILLEPSEVGSKLEPEEERSRCSWRVRDGVWSQLQDVQEAVGLRYQWGGSHCNKVLLCCLGIDTRNILFTGQKKQPVIVPMYAAGLGMLEPTKEPVKPVSAAEMIASIAQTPPAASETSSCQADSIQDVLPPVQFDWSSSGLTNPLDASGGSAVLNLDFFGPVEDSGSSSSASIPGVDPELFELTTAKLDPGGAGSRVADAFARLMSTMEKTSTSTRKPRKDENLSDEASKVIAVLPDLSFMQAKVLMFPATLTPLRSQAMAE
uniref:Aftiphilin a n=1 Tax=Nothobranchius kadleci TaxID=1051664 RepID=A0A1A8E368_NOTKA